MHAYCLPNPMAKPTMHKYSIIKYSGTSVIQTPGVVHESEKSISLKLHINSIKIGKGFSFIQLP